MKYRENNSYRIKRFTRFIVLILIPVCSISQLFAQESENSDLNFIVSPYLQDLSDNSFCVMWETSLPANGQVFLAKTHRHILRPELKCYEKEESPANLHRLTISNLIPGELYFYQVKNISENRDTLEGPVTQIVIPDYNQSAINFTVVGDNQGHLKSWERISDLMFEECPQFVVHVGDFVAYGHHGDDWTDEFFPQAQNLMRHIPLYPAIGNHEMNDERYYRYFNRPYNNAFYTVKKGDLRLFFIDTNKDLLPGSARYRELENALAGCTERWKIAVHHHPVFTSDIASYRSSLMATADKGDPNISHLKDLYESNGVDLVLSGHVHGYERSYPIFKNQINKENGVVYIISAGGGGGCNRESSYKEWFTQATKKRLHYLNVQIEGNTLKVEAVDTSRIVFDTWEVEKQKELQLKAPLIITSEKYFNDTATVTIRNTNESGAINFRVNDENYQTSFDRSVSLKLENTTTVSAFVGEPHNNSRETMKTVTKLQLMKKQRQSENKVTATYYEGNFSMLPDFETLKPLKSFTLDSLAMDGIQPRAKDHFAVCFKGSISVPETSVYRFFLESFDGSMLLIDGKSIIENDGVHYEIFEEGYANLEKGYHDIEVRYFDYVRRETLNIRMGKQDEEMLDINHFIKN